MPASPLSVASIWRTRQRRLRKLVLARPRSIRAPYWRVQLHVLDFLLARYGVEEDSHETRPCSRRNAGVRVGTLPRPRACRPRYVRRAREDVRQCLLRIARANLVRDE